MSLKYNYMVSKKSIYNWVDEGLIKYNKKKIKLSKNNEKVFYEKSNKIDRLVGMDYERFLSYTSDNHRKTIVEMDLVEGIKGSNIYLFIMFIPSIQFVFIFKIKNKYPISVAKVFDWIEKRIGHKNFKRLFRVLLADQGSEFLNHEIITKSIYDSYIRRFKIFYCETGKPYQKGNVENIHRILRRYIPKGVDLFNYSQDDINFIVLNINSMYKPKYKNKFLIELFKERFSKIILNKLSIEEIESEDIIIMTYNKSLKL